MTRRTVRYLAPWGSRTGWLAGQYLVDEEEHHITSHSTADRVWTMITVATVSRNKGSGMSGGESFSQRA